MTTKNDKVLGQLAFAAGLKIEDLREALTSLSSSSEERITDIKEFAEKLKKMLSAKKAEFAVVSPKHEVNENFARPSREEVVRKAIEFITFGWEWKSFYPDYKIDKKNRTVTCTLFTYSSGIPLDSAVVSQGVARCAPGDCFNEHIGSAIALHRAMNMAVPEYLINVPQPDSEDVRKGDIVTFGSLNIEYTVLDPDKTANNLLYLSHRGTYEKAHAPLKNVDESLVAPKIIDDTGRY